MGELQSEFIEASKSFDENPTEANLAKMLDVYRRLMDEVEEAGEVQLVEN